MHRVVWKRNKRYGKHLVGDLPGEAVVKIYLAMLGMRVRVLVGELRSHIAASN